MIDRSPWRHPGRNSNIKNHHNRSIGRNRDICYIKISGKRVVRGANRMSDDEYEEIKTMNPKATINSKEAAYYFKISTKRQST